MAAPQTFKLGIRSGKITDNGDGTASYSYRSVYHSNRFTVRIADVTGFALSRLSLGIMGNGVELARTQILDTGTADKIEAWFRARPDFGANTAPVPTEPTGPAALDSRLVAAELVKLAGLRDAGVLTDDEFAAQKARLLS